MCRIYTSLDCGCLVSEDEGGGYIPCASGFWEMTPPIYAGEIPENFEQHTKAIREYFGR